MLKNLYASAMLILFALFLSPLCFLKGEVIISDLNKSAGSFTTANKLDVSSFINASGVSFNLTQGEVDSLIENARGKKVHSFFDGEILNVYYYSNKIAVKEVIKNKRVNIHVAIKKEEITVGIPIIYYGY